MSLLTGICTGMFPSRRVLVRGINVIPSAGASLVFYTASQEALDIILAQHDGSSHPGVRVLLQAGITVWFLGFVSNDDLSGFCFTGPGRKEGEPHERASHPQALPEHLCG